MDAYEIKYQEIYDEIKDHMISAVEQARAAGDSRSSAEVYEELVEKHFPGYWAFENLSKEYEKAYNAKIRIRLRANIKHYLNVQNLLLIGIFILTGFYVPHNKQVSITLMIILVISALVPYFYVLHKARIVKVKTGKRSLVKNNVTSRASVLMFASNFLLNMVGFLGRDYHITFLNPKNFHPVAYILLISFFVIYGLSAVRLCRQELRLN
jgi:hypothetical protein